MKEGFTSLLLISLFSAVCFSQSLPVGNWQLEEYNFAGKVEHPLDKAAPTLVVRTNGKLGGNSGCNSYGGSYATSKDKVKISDIIHTMMACEEPTPDFETNFFGMLENATSAQVVGKKLLLQDNKGHFLRFVRAGN